MWQLFKFMRSKTARKLFIKLGLKKLMKDESLKTKKIMKV